ncbi:MAG TPA: type II secretion system F family protein [Candidatus Eisenbacteria bacterium]|jgi:type IV pilus assembly protein PilC|nr:type II secretion system F family protein [Candidatus Eisenbacteria bacterium]
MPTYRWQGVSPKGETLKGEMEATSREAVIIRLRTQRIQPVPSKIKEKGKGLDRELALPNFGAPVKAQDIVIFTRQFATMINAGLPIFQCLQILSTQSESKVFRKVISEIKDDVESGSTLADATRKHPKVFPDLYTSLVQAGEIGGILDTILQRLASYLEKAADLKRKIKGAMIYPACIVTAAILVTAVLLIWVIPVFADVFKSFGAQLPAPTQFVINLSNFMVANVYYLAFVPVAAVFAFRAAYRTEQGNMVIDRLLLKAPVFGQLLRKSSVARVTRTLSTLVSSGVPILDALSITARTAGNKVIEKAIAEARQSIASGHTIADPLIASKVFPPMVCQMISVGETTGALDAMLGKIADFYDAEVDQAVANLMSMLEPLVIVFLGVVIGGLVISMYLPIFNLGAVIQ